MTILVDTREKPKIIEGIIKEFDKQNIKYVRTKLFVGDYQDLDNPRLVIDRKHNLAEIALNVVQDHKRFTAELARAKELGIKVVVLCEHGGSIKTLDDVKYWKNPRLKTSPMAVSGERLYKILLAISIKYDVDFLFCSKATTGKHIIELLGTGHEHSVQ